MLREFRSVFRETRAESLPRGIWPLIRWVVFYLFISTQTQPGADTPRTERTFFGQPWGLANLFGIELWERFSFYGMQALLAFYMYYATTDGGLGIDRPPP